MKKSKLFYLPIIGMVFSVVGCGPKGPDLSVKYEELTPVSVNDNYRTFYQIFPVTYADSNNDGIGDLQGIIDKLDYIKSMNYNGIWLNPIHPSTYYHHYDVEDYMNIDPVLGDFEVFDTLVTECHKRDIKIILDMVINHSSNNHRWFKESYKQAKAGNMDNKWALLYNWIDVSDGYVPSGYSKVNDSDKIAYEAYFGGGMPDFNLQPVLDDPENSNIANKIKDIFTLWLVTHNVDGFRFDAVQHFFDNQITKNIEFMTWVNTTCKTLKPDCYLVGEGSWGSNSLENKRYQESGIDSFFNFANSVANGSNITHTVLNSNAKKYYQAFQSNKETAANGIEAPFLDNHDIARFVGGVQGRKDAANTKFALGLLQMLRGTTFTYYGDELGMASQSTVSDGWYRLPMDWGDKYTSHANQIKIIGVSESQINREMSYPHGTVASQLSNSDSVLNYAKKANLIRAAFPEIARGDFELAKDISNSQIIIKRTYNNSSLYMVLNTSNSELEFDYKEYGKPVAELCATGSVQLKELDSTQVIIPPQSMFFLK